MPSKTANIEQYGQLAADVIETAARLNLQVIIEDVSDQDFEQVRFTVKPEARKIENALDLFECGSEVWFTTMRLRLRGGGRRNRNRRVIAQRYIPLVGCEPIAAKHVLMNVRMLALTSKAGA